MLSRRFTFFAVLSLLVFIVSTALGVRSFWASDRLARISQRKGALALDSNSGVLYLIKTGDNQSPWSPGWYLQTRPTRLDVAKMSTHDFLGFQFRGDDPLFHTRFIGIPFWFPAVLGAIAPCIWYVRRVRLRRIALGLCVSCCHDLRGCTDECCPNCGKLIPRPAGALDDGLGLRVDMDGSLRELPP